MKRNRRDSVSSQSDWSRRDLLKGLLGSAGALGLRSLVTGLPVGLLANPTTAKAEDVIPTGRILILAAEQAGSPLNANVPGTYGIDGVEVFHSPFASMVETPLTLAGKATTAAKPWADLPQALLDQAVFFHHRTFAGIHPDFHNVMRCMGETKQSEMAASVYARELAPNLGTVQAAPICLGKESFSYKGLFQARVQPLSLKGAFAPVTGALAGLQDLRDQELDRIHTLVKSWGTAEQADLVDRFALTHEQVRSLSEDITTGFATIDGNDEANQVKAAALIAALNLTPVVTLNIGFGGDNHKDGDLTNEETQHLSGTALIVSLFDQLSALQAAGTLQREVVFAWTSVFGRTLKYGPDGRDHNANHCCTVMVGSSLVGGVVGDARASDISSTTGLTTQDGTADIPVADSLCSMAHTLGRALGVSQPHLNEWIPRGKPVTAVLA